MTLLETRDVLLVEPDDDIRGLLSSALDRLGMTCDAARHRGDAVEQISRARYGVVLVGVTIPRIDVGALLDDLRDRENGSAERPVVLMMTDSALMETAIPDLGEKVQALIQKPFDVTELAELVRDCLEARRAHRARLSAGRGIEATATPAGGRDTSPAAQT